MKSLLFILTLFSIPSYAQVNCAGLFSTTVTKYDFGAQVQHKVISSPSNKITIEFTAGKKHGDDVEMTITNSSTGDSIIRKVSELVDDVNVGLNIPSKLTAAFLDPVLEVSPVDKIIWSPGERYFVLRVGRHRFAIDSHTGKAKNFIVSFLSERYAIIPQSFSQNYFPDFGSPSRGFEVIDMMTGESIYNSVAARNNVGKAKETLHRIFPSSKREHDKRFMFSNVGRHYFHELDFGISLGNSHKRTINVDTKLSFNPNGKFLIENLAYGNLEIIKFTSPIIAPETVKMNLRPLLGLEDVFRDGAENLRQEYFSDYDVAPPRSDYEKGHVGRVFMVPSPKSSKFYALATIIAKPVQPPGRMNPMYYRAMRFVLVEIDPATNSAKVVWKYDQPANGYNDLASHDKSPTGPQYRLAYAVERNGQIEIIAENSGNNVGEILFSMDAK